MVNCRLSPACGAVSHRLDCCIIAKGRNGGQNADPAFCDYQDCVIPSDKTKNVHFGRALPPKYNASIGKAFVCNDVTV